MLRPTRKFRCCLRKRAQSSSSRVPLVCRSFSIRWPGLGVLRLQRDHLLEEPEAQQCGLAALPREHDFVGGDAVDVIAGRKRSRISSGMCPLPGPPGSDALAEVEAVRAVEVASRAGRLGHDVEAPMGARTEPLRGAVLVQTWGGGSDSMRSRGASLWWPKSARPLVKCSAQCFATVLLPRSRVPPSSFAV